MIKKYILYLTISVFAFANILNAEEKKERFINNAIITYENDSVYGPDQYYSNGGNLFLSTKNFNTDKENKVLSKIFSIENKEYHNYSFGFGQKIYTPHDIEITTPQPDDRPYAGYLYFYLNKNIRHNNITDTFGATLGFTGKMSLGEWVQTEVHKMISSPTPEGWDYQIDDEVLFMVSWVRAIEMRSPTPYVFDWNVISKFSTDLGTPFTNVGGAVEFRYGWNLEQDLFSNKITSTSAGIVRNKKSKGFQDVSYYFFLEAEAKVILYNTFLDNSKVSEYDSNIDKNWFFFDVAAGLNLRYRDYYIKYSSIYESKEFKQQDEGQFIFSLALGYLF